MIGTIIATKIHLQPDEKAHHIVPHQTCGPDML